MAPDLRDSVAFSEEIVYKRGRKLATNVLPEL